MTGVIRQRCRRVGQERYPMIQREFVRKDAGSGRFRMAEVRGISQQWGIVPVVASAAPPWNLRAERIVRKPFELDGRTRAPGRVASNECAIARGRDNFPSVAEF
jgi:hypothetical protein